MQHKSILITGCSSGIGLDAALTLQAKGWQVLATCRNPKDCQTLLDQGIDSFVLDYASSESVKAGAQLALEKTNGQLGALFNNGAFAIPGLVEDLPRDALRSIFETNLFGQFELINQVLPAMHKNGYGRIINCSSVLGIVAMSFRGAYNSTKFAMEGLTDTLRLELYHSPIKVVLIQPGPIDTQIRINSRTHFEKWINVDEANGKAVYESRIIPRLYEEKSDNNNQGLKPSAVTEKLIRALDANNPKPRYLVTSQTWIASALRRIMPVRILDRILCNL